MRRLKYVIGSLVIGSVLLFMGTSTSADIKFDSKNEATYEKLCGVRSSYYLNKKACDSFMEYKQNKTKKVVVGNKSKTLVDLEKDIDKGISNVKEFKGDAGELAAEYRKTDEMVSGISKDIKKVEAEITNINKEIKQLDEDIKDSLVVGQQLASPNSVADVVMGALSLDSLVANLTVIKEFQTEVIKEQKDYSNKTSNLKVKQKDLIELKKKLKMLEKEQEERLAVFRAKEASAYTNSYVDVADIDLSDIKESGCALTKDGKFPTPVNKGSVSAGTWYYNGTRQWHSGLDIAVPVGTPIKAACDGVVLAQGTPGSGYGIFTLVGYRIGDNVYTFIYGHLSRYVGSTGTVKKGDLLAYTGNTGNSTGPHVHTEVFKHKTSSIKDIVKVFNNKKDIYFGVGYTEGKNGDCSKDKVCRMRPENLFKVKYGDKIRG